MSNNDGYQDLGVDVGPATFSELATSEQAVEHYLDSQVEKIYLKVAETVPRERRGEFASKATYILNKTTTSSAQIKSHLTMVEKELKAIAKGLQE